ncbi:hypothetical protein WISP_64558 [Willisornis vidua]|uniref:Uncharacterized protein n=1 Tax=Willisornis vidua TaxID=1566151 RepID=A0ABQ9DFG9_9PASS|nr:hypothetical protein WISP_64558 [Willisornis vidua]
MVKGLEGKLYEEWLRALGLFNPEKKKLSQSGLHEQPIFFGCSSNDSNMQFCQKYDIWVPEDTEKEEVRDINAVHTDYSLRKHSLQFLTAMD